MNNNNIDILFEPEDNIDIILSSNENINIDFDRTGCDCNYNSHVNKPKINGHTLQGDMSLEELGIVNDKNYTHNQTVASDEWVIIHNLNKYPAVNIFDSAGDEVVGEVTYDSVNQVTITFVSAFKGKATLN